LFNHPVLDIVPIVLSDEDVTQALSPTVDWVIFTSVQAVRYAEAFLEQLRGYTCLPQFIAIGPATAQAISDAGFHVTFTPADHISSEGLLASRFMRGCCGRQVLILGGLGGRTVLLNGLRRRGAYVRKQALYRRTPGVKPSKATLSTWQRSPIYAIIVTSGEGLTQLVSLVGQTPLDQHWLREQQLLLMSERLVSLAKQYGFIRPPWVAHYASDAGLIARLQQLG
jgi:uroporphyrinogen-III synthase